MAIGQPATTVGALTAKVAKSVANINALRTAMAQVKAQTSTTKPAEPAKGVNK